MKFKEYITEMTKYSRTQKEDLEHFILNVLMNKESADLLKAIEASADKDNITISKKNAKTIINNIKRIRQFVMDLPREE